ncbi:hypothetical protein CY34DRAFT_804636 [Suillus luteus UH-Slu-Lm8-n1]|uniref:Uncharacterized protein n=1 Tax=Suillus luteus UH-Slu-Lm8-n1 TaxID=930992 RepID=A0A0D0AXW2_9AGAM|nr:hypothetical protein CY34DRAFT_804636 [Suillus luteus UH-Slu-Lm8-n1]
MALHQLGVAPQSYIRLRGGDGLEEQGSSDCRCTMSLVSLSALWIVVWTRRCGVRKTIKGDQSAIKKHTDDADRLCGSVGVSLGCFPQLSNVSTIGRGKVVSVLSLYSVYNNSSRVRRHSKQH